MNNKVTAIHFTNKANTQKQVGAKNVAAKTQIKEEDVKKIIQKTTTPGFRKLVLGAASFLAVMFATKRLAVTPLRAVTMKVSPKVSGAVQDFTNKAKPFLAEVGNNLKSETKKFLKGEKFADLTKNLVKDETIANNAISGTYKVAKHLGSGLKKVVKAMLDNPNKVIDYTISGLVAFASSKGLIKIDNLSSKKKIENLLGEEKK